MLCAQVLEQSPQIPSQIYYMNVLLQLALQSSFKAVQDKGLLWLIGTASTGKHDGTLEPVSLETVMVNPIMSVFMVFIC